MLAGFSVSIFAELVDPCARYRSLHAEKGPHKSDAWYLKQQCLNSQAAQDYSRARQIESRNKKCEQALRLVHSAPNDLTYAQCKAGTYGQQTNARCRPKTISESGGECPVPPSAIPPAVQQGIENSAQQIMGIILKR